MPAPIGITSPKQLLVDGADDALFLQSLARHLALGDIQIQRFGGVSELQAFLKALRLAPGFATVETLSVVRDADEDASAAFPVFRALCATRVCPCLEIRNLLPPALPVSRCFSCRPRVALAPWRRCACNR
jgi:hypothetical protein